MTDLTISGKSKLNEKCCFQNDKSVIHIHKCLCPYLYLCYHSFGFGNMQSITPGHNTSSKKGFCTAVVQCIWLPSKSTTCRNTPVALLSFCISWVCFFHIIKKISYRQYIYDISTTDLTKTHPDKQTLLTKTHLITDKSTPTQINNNDMYNVLDAPCIPQCLLSFSLFQL